MFSKKNKRQNVVKARLELVGALSKIHTDLIEFLSTLIILLRDGQFYEVAGRIVKIFELSDLLEKQVKVHMTQEIYKIFETDAKFSYRLDEVEQKRDRVFNWLGETTHMAKQLQQLVKAHVKDPEEIYDCFNVLLERICYDQSLMDFTNTSRFLIVESEIYEASRSQDRLISLFDGLKLHPVVRNASEKLFRDKHYAQAIFETYKTLNNYVKKKSKREDLDGTRLMSEVFGIRLDKKTNRIQRKPILQLNELRNISERDEQEGFSFLFMGSMLGIRNPKAHDLIEQRDPFRTLEYLALASLLAKRVDEAILNVDACIKG